MEKKKLTAAELVIKREAVRAVRNLRNADWAEPLEKEPDLETPEGRRAALKEVDAKVKAAVGRCLRSLIAVCQVYQWDLSKILEETADKLLAELEELDRLEKVEKSEVKLH